MWCCLSWCEARRLGIGEGNTTVSHHWQRKGNCSQTKSPFSSSFLQDDVYPLLWNLVSQSNTLSWHVNNRSRRLIFRKRASSSKQTGLHSHSLVMDVNSVHTQYVGWKNPFFKKRDFSPTERKGKKNERQNIEVLLNGIFTAAKLTCRLLGNDSYKRVQPSSVFLFLKKSYMDITCCEK
jgi:hypothetical protein